MPNYKTPGVYVEEISTLPPSVVSVSTAVPAFVGYTEMGYPANGEHPTAVKISSMLEYRELFGGPKAVKFKAIVTNPEDDSQEVNIQGPNSEGSDQLQYIMYHSLELHFANGGGPCYIVSVGNMDDTPLKKHFTKGLDAIKRKDEPTLIVLTDAVKLPSNYHDLCKQALAQCVELKDRFAIFDVLDTGAGASDDIGAFREGIGMNNLKYGAAYFPYLKTSLNYHYKEEEVAVEGLTSQYASDHNGIKVTYKGPQAGEAEVKIQTAGNDISFAISAKVLTISGVGAAGKTPGEIVDAWKKHTDKQGFDITINGSGEASVNEEGKLSEFGQYVSHTNGIKVTYKGSQTDEPKVKIQETSTRAHTPRLKIQKHANIRNASTPTIEISPDKILTISVTGKEGTTPQAIVDAWDQHTGDKKEFDIARNGNGSENVMPTEAVALKFTFPLMLSDLKTDQTASYNAIKQALARETITLPPSSAIAGIYAKVDRERGVWKAPANVSLSSVIGPQHLITNEQQDEFNVDATTGKSINIIRKFPGKGTLVWGARTLAGNDNEWRYVSVRRLFNNIEESTQKATSFAVFEANDATTWLKVKALIENYLYGLWQRGALAGASPEKAYYVHVGLGKTMTTQDVLEGRMNVEIGIAAVRPAEFIILKFSHKMQEA